MIFTDHAAFQDKFYVGSAHRKVSGREHNLYRKLFVSAELAVRWWSQHDNVCSVAITPTHFVPPHDNLLAAEQTFIQNLQPHSTTHTHPPGGAHAEESGGPRTSTRARASACSPCFASYADTTLTGSILRHPGHAHLQNQACHLDDLSSNTAKSYDAQRQLFHWDFPAQAFAPLCRLAANMPQPGSTCCLQTNEASHFLDLPLLFRSQTFMLHAVLSFKVVYHKNCHVANFLHNFRAKTNHRANHLLALARHGVHNLAMISTTCSMAT